MDEQTSTLLGLLAILGLILVGGFLWAHRLDEDVE